MGPAGGGRGGARRRASVGASARREVMPLRTEPEMELLAVVDAEQAGAAVAATTAAAPTTAAAATVAGAAADRWDVPPGGRVPVSRHLPGGRVEGFSRTRVDPVSCVLVPVPVERLSVLP